MKKLVLYRETVQRLDTESLGQARAGYASFPPAGVGRDSRPVAFRTTDDYSWCIACNY